METVTQNPPPPNPADPTIVPLGVSTILDPLPIQANIEPTPVMIYDMNSEIYVDKFVINRNQQVGMLLYTWKSVEPLGSFSNPYNTIAADGYLRYLNPTPLAKAFYSRMGMIDWEIILTPVKVNDCRVKIEGIIRYGDPSDQLYNTALINNDSFLYHLDAQDDSFHFRPSMFWVTNNVHLNTYVAGDGATRQNIPNAYLPRTTLQLYLGAPYHNSQIQPDSFEVIVTVKPIIRNLTHWAGSSTHSVTTGSIENQTNRPYWLTTINA